jgi:hypothetical protein
VLMDGLCAGGFPAAEVVALTGSDDLQSLLDLVSGK